MPSATAREMYLLTKLEKTRIEYLNGEIIDLVKETEGMAIAHLREVIAAVFCQGQDIKTVLDRLKSMFKIIKYDSEDLKQNKMGIGGR
jgi:hypothetical protein